MLDIAELPSPEGLFLKCQSIVLRLHKLESVAVSTGTSSSYAAHFYYLLRGFRVPEDVAELDRLDKEGSSECPIR